MADAENNSSSFGGPRQEEGRNWTPMIIGGVLVAVAVAIVVIVGRGSAGSEKPNQADPYAARLQLSNLHMATAENFAGGSVTYFEGKITNAGDKKVTGANVELLFKNSLGETAQKEPSVPVMVLLPNVPYADYGPLDRAPLAPGQSRDFRLTLEHVSADWDGQIPQVRVVSVNAG